MWSVQWEGLAPEIGPTVVEVDVPAVAWSTLLDHEGAGIPAFVTACDADGTAQLSLLGGSSVLVTTPDEPPFGVVGTRVTARSAGWTVYPVAS